MLTPYRVESSAHRIVMYDNSVFDTSHTLAHKGQCAFL